MKRIMVIGCPGSGKSTFSRRLRDRTGLPLYHLDNLYWNADRTTVGSAVFRDRLDAVLQEPEWIIDGNYQSTLERRMQRCDTVILLDYPTELCLQGARERAGKPRDDIPWIEEPGQEDPEFIALIQNFREAALPEILELLDRYADRRIVLLHGRDEADAFLAALDGDSN